MGAFQLIPDYKFSAIERKPFGSVRWSQILKVNGRSFFVGQTAQTLINDLLRDLFAHPRVYESLILGSKIELLN